MSDAKGLVSCRDVERLIRRECKSRFKSDPLLELSVVPESRKGWFVSATSHADFGLSFTGYVHRNGSIEGIALDRDFGRQQDADEVAKLKAELEHAKQLLSSGQCVDLAKIGEQGFADIIQGESQPNEEALTEARDILRILIEQAGVKL